MKFPSLFKKTSTGAIQFWTISSGEYDGIGFVDTSYGQLDTDSPQITTDYISKGKNVGKKNETTPGQQADKEAKAKWEKQLKKGYNESIEDAKAGKTDKIIEGGIAPMLAFTFEKQGKKIKYPCYVQPKLDGVRCIAILKDGKCTLWSRTQKPITGVPHINKYIEAHFGGPVMFDGELYVHEYKDNFEKIVSLVRQEEPGDGHEIVQYHIYDLPTNDRFEERTDVLGAMLSYSTRTKGPLVKVETLKVENEDQVSEFYDTFRAQGYEGAMLRNADSLYVNKRSPDLIKVKEMQDAEFEIVGIEEGRGKLAGHVGAFVCKNEQGQEFKAKMSGDTGKLKDYFEQPILWQGKLLTVQFQDLTSYGIPRFPVGKNIRDYE